MTSSFVTQSRLGSWFNLSSIKVGKILAANGLKDRQGATQMAVAEGFAKEAQTQEKILFWVWDPVKVAPMLDEALRDVEKPYIDDLVVQVGEALTEADRHRAEGSDYIADLIEEQALAGVPSGLVVLIRARLKNDQGTDVGVKKRSECNNL